MLADWGGTGLWEGQFLKVGIALWKIKKRKGISRNLNRVALRLMSLPPSPSH